MTLPAYFRSSLRAVAVMILLVLGVGLGGCANMGDSMLSAFADPAKYEYFDCKQLEAERKSLANRSAELQGLMAKAETGTGGTVVGELAYRNDYISARAQAKLVEEAWQRGKCHETPPAVTPPVAPAAPPVKDKSAHSHSKSGNVAN
jgi:hypothetical protein